MSIQEVSAEQLIQLFRHYHQALAADSSARSNLADLTWQEIPQQEKDRIVTAARLALLELGSIEEEARRRYFAKPGAAEWGC